jgi:DNA (cytosine-5)-methyltransferase 1
MNVLDLFSGIGGFSLGLERAGMRTVGFVEIKPYCRAVLAKHWPGVPCHDDITTRDFKEGEADIICGGFPCQDISLAGEGAGITGSRSGLWRELVRAIRMVRPRFAIVENVAALLGRGMGVVLGDLATIGADAEWHCIPASSVGLPHRRDRVWVVAYPHGGRWSTGQQAAAAVGHGHPVSAEGGDVAHAIRLEGSPILAGHIAEQLEAIKRSGSLPDAHAADGEALPLGGSDARGAARRCYGWLVEPDVGRVAHGVPARVDRLEGLGNAVVPQIPEAIGRAVMRIALTSTDCRGD